MKKEALTHSRHKYEEKRYTKIGLFSSSHVSHLYILEERVQTNEGMYFYKLHTYYVSLQN